MISVTKSEAQLLRELFPNYKVARTMKQDSKRHHYFATESEALMRAISSTNAAAAEFVAKCDREHELAKKRAEIRGY